MLAPIVEIGRATGGPLVLGDDTRPFVGGQDADQSVRWGGTTWERALATSPWVHGEAVVAARKRNSQLELAFHVIGTDLAAVNALMDEAATALAQFSYAVNLRLGGSVTHTFRGYAADVGFGFTRAHLWAFVAPVTAVIPVLPVGTTI